MKNCSLCKEEKLESEFPKQAKAPDKLHYWCRECFKKYRKNRREKDPQGHKDYTNARRENRISWLQDLKSNTPCMDCGQIYEPFCMDYDHVPEKGLKIKPVTRMLLDNSPKEIILEEIKKCDLICLLCHNKRTYDRFNEKLGDDRKYRAHQIRNINIINDFKDKPCNICEIQYELYNMQIDHIDPSTKLYDVCDLKNYKESTLLSELSKCQVLCALCHRRKSIEEQQDDKYNVERQLAPKRIELFYDSIANTKECGRCHEIKDSSCFRINKKTKSGLDTYCKDCFNEYRRERRK